MMVFFCSIFFAVYAAADVLIDEERAVTAGEIKASDKPSNEETRHLVG